MNKQETICLKELNLVTPGYARQLGIVVDRPVFVSSSDSTDSRPPIYEVGTIIKVSQFEPNPGSFVTAHKVDQDADWIHSRPKYGLGYWEFPISTLRHVASDGRVSLGDLNTRYWIAQVEPLGTVVEHEDYFFQFNRITDELIIKKIMVSCYGCPDGPLNQGMVLQPYNNGFLYAWCLSDIHKEKLAPDIHDKTLDELLAQKHYLFELGPNLEVILSDT